MRPGLLGHLVPPVRQELRVRQDPLVRWGRQDREELRVRQVHVGPRVRLVLLGHAVRRVRREPPDREVPPESRDPPAQLESKARSGRKDLRAG